MELFFSAINNPLVPWGLAFTIIALGLSVWIFFRWRLWPFFVQLRQVQLSIDNIPPEDLVSYYEDLNERLQAAPLLAPQWEAFKQTLILPLKPNEPIYYTRRPAFYFNEATVIAPKINLALYQSVPNILVGIGLFFTFIGLVAALWFASEGVAAPDVEQAQQALRDLLHAATFKFVTSIAGLLGSIVFSWREKALIHQLQKRLHILAETLEARLIYLTPEQITSRQLREMSKQTEQLERFNSEFAVSIANALEDTFSDKLVTALQPLSSALSGLVDKVGGMNQDALERMLQEFSQKLQGAAGEELKQLAASLQELVPAFGELRQQFDHSGSDFGAKMGDAAHALQQGLTHATDTLVESMSETNRQLQQSAESEIQKLGEPLQQLAISLTELSSRLDAASDNIHTRLTTAAHDSAGQLTVAGEKVHHYLENGARELSQTFGQTTTDFNTARTALSEVLQESNDTYRKALKQLQDIHKGLTSTQESLQVIGDPMTQTASTLASTVQGVQTLSSSVNEASQSLLNSNQTVTQVWQQYQTRFEQVDEDVAKVFQELSSGVENYRQQVEGFTRRLDDSLNNAVKSLSSVITELVEAIEELQLQQEKAKKKG